MTLPLEEHEAYLFNELVAVVPASQTWQQVRSDYEVKVILRILLFQLFNERISRYAFAIIDLDRINEYRILVRKVVLDCLPGHLQPLLRRGIILFVIPDAARNQPNFIESKQIQRLGCQLEVADGWRVKTSSENTYSTSSEWKEKCVRIKDMNLMDQSDQLLSFLNLLVVNYLTKSLPLMAP